MPKSLPSRAWRTAAAVFALAFGSATASAQSLPVSVEVAGNTATVEVGNLGLNGHPLADLSFTFDDVDGLTAQSIGVSAQVVDLADPLLRARLPDLQSLNLDGLPLLITVEPPRLGGRPVM